MNEKIWLDNVFKHISSNDQPYMNVLFDKGCENKSIINKIDHDDTPYQGYYEVTHKATNMMYKDRDNPDKSTNMETDMIGLDWNRDKSGYWKPQEDKPKLVHSLNTDPIATLHQLMPELKVIRRMTYLNCGVMRSGNVLVA